MTTTVLNSDRAVVIAAATAFTCFCPPQYSPELTQLDASRIAPIASFGTAPADAETPGVETAQEMIFKLRKGGMPVSAIAEAMRVERKSIYAWIDGGHVRPANASRAEQICSLLTGVDGVDARGIYRLWNTVIDGKSTLRDLVTTENLDVPRVRLALDRARPAALRLSQNEKRMKQGGAGNAFLDEIPEAGLAG